MEGKEFIQKLVALEGEARDNRRRIEQLEKNNEALRHLEKMVEIQIITNENQSKQMESFSKTLVNVNNNLTELNYSHQALRTDVNKMGDRVKHVEEHNEKTKISIPQLITAAFSTAVTTVIIAAIFYFKG